MRNAERRERIGWPGCVRPPPRRLPFALLALAQAYKPGTGKRRAGRRRVEQFGLIVSVALTYERSKRVGLSQTRAGGADGTATQHQRHCLSTQIRKTLTKPLLRLESEQWFR